LEDCEIRYRRDRLLHGRRIKPAVRLRARSAHGRTFAPVEHAELDPTEIGDPAHKTIEGIDFAHEMPLAETSDCGIAGHCADGREAMGDKRGFGAHARGGRGGLAAGMAATDDNNIVFRIHRILAFGASL
jgi:hypothetical protein